MPNETAAEIARTLTPLEREWLTGWQGPGGAAFNAIAGYLLGKGLLISDMDWSPNALGLEVRAILEASK